MWATLTFRSSPTSGPMVDDDDVAQLKVSANAPTMRVRCLAYRGVLMLDDDVICKYKINGGIWIRSIRRVVIF